jgi:CubicO group peptidase (beta-lactamase class C family)
MALMSAAIAMLASTPGASTAPQSDAAFERLSALVTQKMTEYNVPGVAFGIVKNGRAIVRGFGVTNIDDPQPITADTIFPVASISKTVTATAIMRLVEQGRLDLEAPVQRYLPGFRVQDERVSREVAIWHLLTHTPGWEGQISSPDRGVDSLAAFAESMKGLPQIAAPGEVWSYNNAGFTLAGRVIEQVTGQSIHDALRTLVFEPLGLARTFTRLESVATYPFSVAHGSQPPVVMRPMARTSGITAGGVSMSLNDLLAYARFHLGDGARPDGKPVLTRASLDVMRTARVKKAGTDDEMGLGWHLRRIGGVMTAAHGGTLGHCLLVELVPSRTLALAILTNHTGGWRLIQDVERAALRTLEGLSLDPAHAIGHRGVNETMPDAPVLAAQPDASPYVGTYRRPPVGSYTVRLQGTQLMLDNASIAFYAADRAVVTSGNSRGNPVEFIRRADGAVGWVRVVGRIARKE